MNQFVIHERSDIFYLPTVVDNFGKTEISLRCDNKFDDLELSIIRKFNTRSNDKLDKIIFTELDSLVVNSEYRTLSPFGINPLDKVSVLLYYKLDPVLTGESITYDNIKRILNQEGALYLFRWLKVNDIKSYQFTQNKEINKLSIDVNPIEFFLLQLGLSRVDSIEFEDDSFNTESNDEGISRYNNNRVITHENDSLSGNWREYSGFSNQDDI